VDCRSPLSPWLWLKLVREYLPRWEFWGPYRWPPPRPHVLGVLLRGWPFRKNCFPAHPLEVETFFKASAASSLSLATLPKSVPNRNGGASEKPESSTRLFSFGFSCCSSAFLLSAAKCWDVLPMNTRAAWVLATAASGVRSPASANSIVATRGFMESRRN